MLLLRRFGGARGLVLLGLLNFVRRLLGRRKAPPGVYEPGAPEIHEPGVTDERAIYQPSQGSSQTVQRRPR